MDRTRLALLVWSGVVLLGTLGVGAAVGRTMHLGDFARRVDPFRQHVLDAFHREDPHAAQRILELQRVDERFAASPYATLLHTIPGGIFLILGPLQFVPRVRNRHVQLHRWSGRLLVAIGSLAVLTGLYFGLLIPYAGWGESTAIALVGALFLAATGRAIVAIRRGQVSRHREWMIRAFAVGIGISAVRLVALLLDFLFSPAGLTPKALFVASLWIGWAVTLAAAELWIRFTRPSAAPGPADRPVGSFRPEALALSPPR